MYGTQSDLMTHSPVSSLESPSFPLWQSTDLFSFFIFFFPLSPNLLLFISCVVACSSNPSPNPNWAPMPTKSLRSIHKSQFSPHVRLEPTTAILASSVSIWIIPKIWTVYHSVQSCSLEAMYLSKQRSYPFAKVGNSKISELCSS